MAAGDARIFVGIDWATEVHDACIVDRDGSVLGERRVKHTAQGLAQLCEWVTDLARKNGGSACVAIELTSGPVIDTLLERGFSVFAINPKQLDRFRDRFTVAGAKDDRLDARVLADSLRTDAHCFRRLAPDDPQIIRLRDLSRMGDDLQRDRVRLSNQIREQLRRYYPQFLALADDIAAAWMIALWHRMPSPAAAKGVHATTVATILKQHRIRKVTAKDVLEALRATPLTVAAGVVESACMQIEMLFERLAVLNEQLKRCRKQAARVLDQLNRPATDDAGPRGEPRDVEIILSLPGVGPITCATLLAEAPRAIHDRDYPALRSLSGVAPVTRRSGKRKLTISMRHACSDRLRNAMYHMARVAAQRDLACKDRYTALRAKGHSHGRALRSIADRLLRVLMAMLRTKTTYRIVEQAAA